MDITKQVGASISIEDYKKLKKIGEKYERSISFLIKMAVSKYLKEIDSKINEG